MIRFKLHGFHILEVLNANLKLFQKGHYQFYVIGTLKPYHDNQEIILEAIIYDEKRKEYQMFNYHPHIVIQGQVLNHLFEMFLEEIYLNMVFSVETEGKLNDHSGRRLYSFRDLLIGIYKNNRLPNPKRDFEDIRNFQDAFGNDVASQEFVERLQLKSHSD